MGSGGHNKKSLEELQRAGTVRVARHLLKPTAKEDAAALQTEYETFLKRLETARAPEFWTPLDDYARDVTDGVVSAGRLHRLACVRHQRDVEHVFELRAWEAAAEVEERARRSGAWDLIDGCDVARRKAGRGMAV